jgi:hypothetical protein
MKCANAANAYIDSIILALVLSVNAEGKSNEYLLNFGATDLGGCLLQHPQPKVDRTQKRKFWSVPPTYTIVVYATLPERKAIGTVKVVRRESLTVDQLWRASQQVKLAKVSRVQFDAYYANQESGIRV